MQQATASTSAPSSTASSFAGLLASLASPGDKSSSAERKDTPPWEDDELRDDIATLSYESALRAHTRYRSPAVGDNFLAQGATDLLEMLRQEPTPPAAATLETPPERSSVSQSVAAAEPELRQTQLSSFERSLKNASITIRMSKSECAQLHTRAAEAGMTVSAYLRSCTFEAESLRAMVKETMAQLRSASAQTNLTPNPDSRLRRLGQWLARSVNPWQQNQRVARA